MDSRYLRNFPALTREEWQLLRQRRVLIVGCGGIGGYLVELLTRIGLGSIRVCDGDVLEASNLNRQLLSDGSRLGVEKTRAAADWGRRVNPDVSVETRQLWLSSDNVFDLIRDCDAVLDALDNVESRKILAYACAQVGIPYIFGAVGGWIAQAAVSMPGDGLVDTLYPEEAEIRDKSVLSFTPALCAAVQAALCVKLLTGRPVETGKVLYFDLLNQEFDTIPVALGRNS